MLCINEKLFIILLKYNLMMDSIYQFNALTTRPKSYS